MYQFVRRFFVCFDTLCSRKFVSFACTLPLIQSLKVAKSFYRKRVFYTINALFDIVKGVFLFTISFQPKKCKKMR